MVSLKNSIKTFVEKIVTTQPLAENREEKQSLIIYEVSNNQIPKSNKVITKKNYRPISTANMDAKKLEN